MVDVKERSCLGFLYITTNVHYRVYMVSASERQEIIRIEQYEQLAAWQSAAVSVPPGRYAIVFEARFVQNKHEQNNGIANIILTAGACEHISAGKTTTFMFFYFVLPSLLWAGLLSALIVTVFIYLFDNSSRRNLRQRRNVFV